MTLRKRGDTGLKEEALDRAVENSFWKGLWTCRKTDCVMMMMIIIMMMMMMMMMMMGINDQKQITNS
jgi:hypothetical protein